MVSKKYKYKLVLYDYDANIDNLGPALSDVLGFDLTQVGNIINIITLKGSYCIKTHNSYTNIVDDYNLLTTYDVFCCIEKELQSN